MSVLKLNINICTKWDTLIVMENSEYLARKFSCIVKKNEAHYIILGGRNNFNYPTDDIVEIEIKGKKIKVTQDNDKKISNKAEFVNFPTIPNKGEIVFKLFSPISYKLNLLISVLFLN